MQFPKSLHSAGWHARMPVRPPDPPMPLASHDAAAEDGFSPNAHRRFHILAAVIAVGALLASAGLDAMDDQRPLDVQLSAAMHGAGDTLKGWQEQLSRGLQVSLRAVADGRDAPPAETAKAAADPALLAQAETAAAPTPTATADREQPVRADLAPRQLQPSR